MIDTELTDEQAARSIRRLGADNALRAAPDVIAFARARIARSFAGERGDHLTEARTPLHTGWTDTADAAYAQLVDWVTYWAIELGVPGPTLDSPWLRGEEVLGFRAGTSPEDAAELTADQARWLRQHLDQIERLATETPDTFFADVPAIVWSLKAMVGMSHRDRPPAGPRPCPVCGKEEIRGEFWGESMTAAELRGERWVKRVDNEGSWRFQDMFLEHIARVKVVCSNCGYEVKATDRKKLKWLR